MTPLDAALLAVFVGLSVRGLFRGLVREVFSVAAWIGGGLAAAMLSPGAAVGTAESLGISLASARWVAAIGIFAGAYVVLQIAGRLLHRVASAALLGPLNRLGGFAFGGAKAIVLSALVLLAADRQRFLPGLPAAIDDSVVASVLVQAADETLTDLSTLWDVSPAEATPRSAEP